MFHDRLILILPTPNLLLAFQLFPYIPCILQMKIPYVRNPHFMMNLMLPYY